MAALATVADYITGARRLLLDETAPYRYADTDLMDALNYAMLEARRMRPDLFLPDPSSITMYTATGDTVVMDMQYRMAVLFYICGHMQLIDTEDTADARASAFMARFLTQMTALG